jgi:hypothetical protein
VFICHTDVGLDWLFFTLPLINNESVFNGIFFFSSLPFSSLWLYVLLLLLYFTFVVESTSGLTALVFSEWTLKSENLFPYLVLMYDSMA